MLRLLLAAVFAFASPPLSTLEIELSAGAAFSATLTFPGSAGSSGDFQGRVALYGSPSELRVSGARLSRAGRPPAIRMAIRYADIPADWIARFRPDGFDYRLTGTLGGAPVSWAGRFAWNDVPVSGEEAVRSRFLSLEDIELTSPAPSRSRGLARLRVTNPFAFPLQLARSDYRLEADGREVGRGSTRGVLVRPGTTVLDFPIEVNHGQLLAAAGSALLTGGAVDARLVGSLTVKLSGGEVRVPLDLAGQIDAGGLAGR